MNARGARHGYCRGMDPILKADFPTHAPKRHGQGLPRCAPGFPLYDTGARPHMSYRLTRSAKKKTAMKGACNHPRLCAPSFSPQPAIRKANRRTRSVQPPRGYTPLHLRRNQRSRRRTTAQEAYNCPVVVRPLSFAATGGPTWGPRPTCHATGTPVTGCGKSHRRSRQCHVSSGPSRKTEKISFQNQCSDSRHPAHGPSVTLSTKVTGQSTLETGVAVSVTIGGPEVTASTGAQKQ
jgi:hypothetical protein